MGKGIRWQWLRYQRASASEDYDPTRNGVGTPARAASQAPRICRPDFGFPARRNIPLAPMLRPYREQEAQPSAEAIEAELPAADVAANPLPHPWFGRLRSSSHLVAPPPVETPPPLPPPAAAPPASAPPPQAVAALPPVLGPGVPPLVRFPIGRRLPILSRRVRRADSADA